MIIKLEFTKDFDIVSWKYMKHILLAFGFQSEWVNWILKLTSTAFFSILVNGTPSKTFTPSRGIRQGDPLSPFLFVIMVEGISRYIKAHINNGNIKGLHLSGINPPVSHSQFIDDTMMLGEATAKEATTIHNILSYFSAASGISINSSKSQFFFLQHSRSDSEPPIQHPRFS
jgi:hypothetical protein